MSYDPYQCFLAYFRFLVKSSHYGKQAEMARSIGKTPRHVSSVLKGKSKASYKMQELIANHFETTLHDMQKEGEKFLENISDKNESRPRLNTPKTSSILEKLKMLEARIANLEKTIFGD